jgi:CRISPR/Cas system-associated protein Cas10 (large subunit of type III CRISPR-Cas system)
MNAEDLIQIPALPRVWSDEATPPRREALWIKEGKKCHWCGRPTRLTVESAPDQATTEHIIPRYKGGSNEPENLVSACRECNGRRNSEDMKGLPEGALKPGGKGKSKVKRIALSGDEKRTILARIAAAPAHYEPIDVVREQREQALKTVMELRTELKQWKATVAEQERKLKTMTVWQVIRRDLVELLKEQ